MKKFLALLLALVMTLALAACGGSGNDAQKDNSSGAVTIKVGGIGPLTGDLAQYGTATAWGAQIAVDEINALGGPIKLEYD